VPDYNALWTSVKAYWKPVSEVGGVISSTGFIGYAYKEIRKRYQKPELTCSLTINKNTIIPLGEYVQNSYGEEIFINNGTGRITQECTFSIANTSEYIAYELRVRNNNDVDWHFPLDYTTILKSFDKQSINIVLRKVLKDDVLIDMPEPIGLIIQEIVIDYKNTSNRKYRLIFKPLAEDEDKRTMCIRIK